VKLNVLEFSEIRDVQSGQIHEFFLFSLQLICHLIAVVSVLAADQSPQHLPPAQLDNASRHDSTKFQTHTTYMKPDILPSRPALRFQCLHRVNAMRNDTKGALHCVLLVVVSVLTHLFSKPHDTRLP
jgi:hypothetical protein